MTTLLYIIIGILISSIAVIEAVTLYIKEKALAWSVTYNDELVIDNINISTERMDSITANMDLILKRLSAIDELVMFVVRYGT